MPIFEYTALTNQGKKEIQLGIADSKWAMLEELKKIGLFPIAIKPVDQLPPPKKLTKKQLVAWTADVAQLLKAHLPLYEAIVSVQRKKMSLKEQVFMVDILDRLKKGMLLSKILKTHAQPFDPVYIAMIQAGEETGTLAQVYGELADLLKKQEAVERKIAAQLAYPRILAAVSGLLVIGVLTYLIPSFKELIDQRHLKGLTKWVFKSSDLLIHHPLKFFTPFVVIPAVSRLLSCVAWVKDQKESLKLRLPLIKTFYIARSFSQFALVVKILLQAKLPPVEALKLAKGGLSHPRLIASMERIIQGMKEGRKLSEEMKKSALIPSFVCQVIASREELSALSDAFEVIYRHYEELLDQIMQKIASFMQPCLFVILGLVIGMIILAVLIPLTDTSHFSF